MRFASAALALQGAVMLHEYCSAIFAVSNMGKLACAVLSVPYIGVALELGPGSCRHYCARCTFGTETVIVARQCGLARIHAFELAAVSMLTDCRPAALQHKASYSHHSVHKVPRREYTAIRDPRGMTAFLLHAYMAYQCTVRARFLDTCNVQLCNK